MKRYSEVVIDIFNRYADRYDSWYERNRVTAENEARLVTTIVGNPAKPCIEIGGGTGYFSSLFNCINLDPSREMLTISRRKRGLEAIEAYGESLPIRSRSVGLILIIVTICFVESPESIIRESYRVLRDDGTMVMCIIPKDSRWGEYYAGKKDSPFYRVARLLTGEEALSLLTISGFYVKEVLGTLSYPPLSQPYREDPSVYDGSHGFICIKAVKTNGQRVPRTGFGRNTTIATH